MAILLQFNSAIENPVSHLEACTQLSRVRHHSNLISITYVYTECCSELGSLVPRLRRGKSGLVPNACACVKSVGKISVNLSVKLAYHVVQFEPPVSSTLEWL